MNIVLILIDSLNRDHLSAYGAAGFRTPNIDRFAQRATRFDNHYVGSLPCMPARREIFTGRKEMMWRPWGPLEHFDARLPRVLAQEGYATAIVTDHYHYWEEAANGYVQSFDSMELVRGHEMDNWKRDVASGEEVPEWVKRIEKWRGRQARRYYANAREFRDEADFTPARTMNGAARWLRENYGKQKFFLQIESFDVHEPFYLPEPFASMYGRGGDRDRFTLWPPYQDPDVLDRFMKSASKEELAYIASQYAGKLSMLDRWFGEVLATLDSLDAYEDTCIILTTDHGHDLGGRGQFGKEYPHHDTHANIPLFVWHPSLTPKVGSIQSLTATVDLFSTILDIAGAPSSSAPHSMSLLPLLAGKTERIHESLLYGTFGQGVCLTDGEWTLFKSPDRLTGSPLFAYSTQWYKSLLARSIGEPVESGRFIPGVDAPQWKFPVEMLMRPRTTENFLYNRLEDPRQRTNLWASHAPERARLLKRLREMLDAEGCPPEQYTRLGL